MPDVEGDVECWRCHARGWAIDEFIGPFNGLCWRCNREEKARKK